MQSPAQPGMMQKSLTRRCVSLAHPHMPVARPCQPSTASPVPNAQPRQQLAARLGAPCNVNTIQSQRVAAVVAERASSSDSSSAVEQRPLKVLIAGAGIGGLVLAVSLMRKGIDVAVFERDFTAIRGEGKYRGPIQVGASHALPHGSMPG
mgnify:CR=1 FL=1